MTESPQDHPGPEWVEQTWGNGMGEFAMPYLPMPVTISYSATAYTRADAIARCRAISAAALAWEVKKRDALAAALCEREEI